MAVIKMATKDWLLRHAGHKKHRHELEYFDHVNSNGFLKKRRMEQSRHWMFTTIQEQLLDGFYHDPIISKRIKEIEKRVMDGRMTSFQGAVRLIAEYRKGDQDQHGS